MKHIVEIKLPKLFGKNKSTNDSVIQPEDIEEVIIETKNKLEETSNNFRDTVKLLSPFAVALVVGYVAGYNRGLIKGLIKDSNDRVIVITKGD